MKSRPKVWLLRIFAQFKNSENGARFFFTVLVSTFAMNF